MDYLTLVKDSLKTYFPDYEPREEQEKMWEVTYRAMKENEKITIHAPTGTGKTFGYIVPFIAVKLENPAFKAVFTTFTINLQEQLTDDLKIGIELYEHLQKTLSLPQKPMMYASLYGNSNYFCEKSYTSHKNNGDFTSTVSRKVDEALRLNLPKTKQAFGRIIEEKDWENMKIESCSKKECPFHKTCTYYNDYQKISKADVIIANHALFFRRYFFIDEWEGFNFFVFDEAHKVEKSILDSYTFSLSEQMLENWVEEGMTIASLVKADEEKAAEWKDRFGHDHKAIKNFHYFLSKVMLFKNNEDTDFIQTFDFQAAQVSMKEVKQLIFDLFTWQKDMVNNWFFHVIPDKSRDLPVFKEKCESWKTKLVELREFASLSNSNEREGLVWFEIPKSKEEIFMKITPQHLSDIKTPFRTGTLLTSGTIAENNSCSSLAARLSLSVDHDLVLPSPFSLQDQTIVHVNPELNPKNANSHDPSVRHAYVQGLAEEIYELCTLGRQKTFILFTSHGAMWAAFKQLAPRLREMNTYKDQPIDLWIQQKNNYKDVMTSFRSTHSRSILFATLSYFEGIDLKGDSLSQIILTKLPYSSPDHPIQQILERNEGYTNWEALVRFEQAYGRLIRTTYDYGSFHILDNRVATYLPQFIQLFHNEGVAVTDKKEDVVRFFSQQSDT